MQEHKKILIRKIFFGLITVLLAVLIVFSVVKAGSFSPGGSPAASMKTLNDIYTRLSSGGAAGTHTLTTSNSPNGTMRTLDEIYNIIPANDKICSGTNSGTATCGGTPAPTWTADPGFSLCYSTYGCTLGQTGAIAPFDGGYASTLVGDFSPNQYYNRRDMVSAGGFIYISTENQTSVPFMGYYSNMSSFNNGDYILDSDEIKFYKCIGEIGCPSSVSPPEYIDATLYNQGDIVYASIQYGPWNFYVADTTHTSNGSSPMSDSAGSWTSFSTKQFAAYRYVNPSYWEESIAGSVFAGGFYLQTSLYPYSFNLATQLGASEYCAYLNSDGTTLSDNSVGYWRLPTIAELTKVITDNPSYVWGNYCWSTDPVYGTNNSVNWVATYNNSYLDVSQKQIDQSYSYYNFRCVHQP